MISDLIEEPMFWTVVFIVCVITITATFIATDTKWKSEAVAVGKAEYYLSVDGETKWRWKTAGDQESCDNDKSKKEQDR